MQLFSYLLDSISHPQKKLVAAGSIKRSAALIVAILLQDDNRHLNSAFDISTRVDSFNAVLTNLMSACSLYGEILSMEFAGVILLDRCDSLVRLIGKHRAISMCVIRWLNFSLLDNSFVSSPSYATLCPVLLQIVVTAIELYPLQHPDCFAILCLMHKNSDSGRSVETVSIKRDIIDCLVYLLGKGYISEPLNFLSTEVLIADAAVVRHIVLILLESFSPPFDLVFAEKVARLVINAANRKSLSSKYFHDKCGPILVRKFCDQLSDMSSIDHVLLDHLRSAVSSCTT